jgi:hypothetical protein
VERSSRGLVSFLPFPSLASFAYISPRLSLRQANGFTVLVLLLVTGPSAAASWSATWPGRLRWRTGGRRARLSPSRVSVPIGRRLVAAVTPSTASGRTNSSRGGGALPIWHRATATAGPGSIQSAARAGNRAGTATRRDNPTEWDGQKNDIVLIQVALMPSE